MNHFWNYIPTINDPVSENKIRANRPKHEHRHALNTHSSICPRLSDKIPKIGPPAAPPISNNVDNSPAVNGEYPRESFRYNGSQKYSAEIGV